AQQLRADRDVGGLCRLEVDAQTDAALVRDELNHSPLIRKRIAVADRQNVPVLERRENLRDPFALRLADEEHIAFPDVRELAIAAKLNGSRAETLATNRLVEEGTERIIAEDADEKWALGIRRRG